MVVVAVGAMVATLPVAAAPGSAFQLTLAAWPGLSLVASASAKLAEACNLVRSASWTKPRTTNCSRRSDDDDEDEPLPPVAAAAAERARAAGTRGAGAGRRADRAVDGDDGAGHRRGQHRAVHRLLRRVDRRPGRGDLGLAAEMVDRVAASSSPGPARPRAAVRLDCAVFSSPAPAVGSTLASTSPFLTWSPTLTSISVTVPAVAKAAPPVIALGTVPEADTVAVTVALGHRGLLAGRRPRRRSLRRCRAPTGRPTRRRPGRARRVPRSPSRVRSSPHTHARTS